MEKKYLIVVDMQKDFIDGALGTEEAKAIVPAAVERIRACKEEEYSVIATMDTHESNYLETQEGKYLPVPHCISGTEGWKMNESILGAIGDALFIQKSTFGSLMLPEVIRDSVQNGDTLTIEVMGLCTDICVVSNVLILKANFPEAAIGVRASCCAGVTLEKHRMALETMASCQIKML